VKFPLTLDVYELCRPELQQKLIPIRDRFKIMDDKKLEEEKVHFYCRKLRMDRDSTSLKNTSKTSMFGAKPFVGNSLVTSQRRARSWPDFEGRYEEVRTSPEIVLHLP
jgi:hypothetical protein